MNTVIWLDPDNQGPVVSWLSEPAANIFLTGLQQLLDLEIRTLKNSDTLVEIHRAQGRVQILEKLLKLKGDLSNVVRQETKGR